LKVLITGGTGFIGSHLVENMVQKGHQVRCLIRKTSDLKWLKNLPIEVTYGDCIDKSSLAEAVKSVDMVFHLAGLTKALKEEDYYEVNAFGTKNLLQACLTYNPKIQKFIYLSSQAASGPCQNGKKKSEEDPCEPVSPYGKSKRMGEQFLLDHVKDIHITIIRPCAVYGPREKDIYAYFKYISKGIKPLFLGGKQRISLIYVNDIIDGIFLALEANIESGEIFFLSDGEEYELREIGDIISETMGINTLSIPVPKSFLWGIAYLSEFFSKITRRPPLINRGKINELIQIDWLCDITKAKTKLGFNPKIKLSEGVRLTLEWYKKEKWL